MSRFLVQFRRWCFHVCASIRSRAHALPFASRFRFIHSHTQTHLLICARVQLAFYFNAIQCFASFFFSLSLRTRKNKQTISSHRMLNVIFNAVLMPNSTFNGNSFLLIFSCSPLAAVCFILLWYWNYVIYLSAFRLTCVNWPGNLHLAFSTDHFCFIIQFLFHKMKIKLRKLLIKFKFSINFIATNWINKLRNRHWMNGKEEQHNFW